MAKTTGIILTIGGITLANKVIVNGEPVDWRIPIATGLAAGAFALGEKLWEPGAVGLAYLALVTVLFVRVDPQSPTPVENFNKWYNGK